MRLALSNLAFEYDNIDDVSKILSDNNINSIEMVFTKISEWGTLTDVKIKNLKDYLDKKNITIKSAQSLFYGIICDNINNEKIVIPHFIKLVELSKKLGIEVLVLGSPTLRKNSPLNSIFTEIDNILNDTGIELSIEPNSKVYGGDYFYSIDEIVSFIRSNNFNNIKTMIDTHNIILEDGNPIKILEDNFKYINHIHISEYGLVPIQNNQFHNEFSKKLKDIEYDGVVTYELMNSTDLKNEIKMFSHLYGDSPF
jgi:sugar phosphate isomerase/epimerase